MNYYDRDKSSSYKIMAIGFIGIVVILLGLIIFG